jgi:phage shock protein PspC (stress-responsive transcriptional regulator)
MNKVLNINLGGIAFTIDDDAFHHLENYVNRLKLHFQNSEGCDEIISDIEARIAEIFTERLGTTKNIVQMKDVNEAIAIMGTPEEFGAEPGTENTFKSSTSDYRTGRRLFRDPEDKFLSGVCSGLSAYFGISDPLWVRLIFLILFFVFGTGFLLYLVLAVLVPTAKTASDRLAMRGDPINVDNIAKNVEKDLTEFGERLGKIGEDFKGKKNSFSSESSSKAVDGFSNFIRSLGGIIITLITGFIQLLGGFGKIIGIFFLVALFFGLLGSLQGIFWGWPTLNQFSPLSVGSNIGAAISWIGILAIPVIVGILFFGGKLFKSYIPNFIFSGLGVVWLLSLGFGGYYLAKVMDNYSKEATVTDTKIISLSENDTLSIFGEEKLKKIGTKTFKIRTFGTKGINWTESIPIEIEKSNTGEIKLLQISKAFGHNEAQAEERAQSIPVDIIQSGNSITLPSELNINKIGKFYNQSVKYILQIPEGKFIKFDENSIKNLENLDLYDREISPRKQKDGVWKMTSTGLQCVRCTVTTFSSTNEYSSFESIDIEANVDVEIKKGEKYEISYDGDDIKDDFEIIMKRENLKIRENGGSDARKMIITLPNISAINAQNLSGLKITGFNQDDITLNLGGEYLADLNGDFETVTLNLDNDVDLRMKGRGKSIISNLNSSKLNSEDFIVDDITLNLTDSQAKVYANKNLVQNMDENSSVKISGNPKNIVQNKN